jgi:hypothetical protein
MYRSMVSRGNNVFMTITCSDRERFKGGSVQ